MSITHVTQHFQWIEFDSHDGEEVPLECQPAVRYLCKALLEPIRERWKGPLIITSGWRSKVWNARVGGAKASRHLNGSAADIRPVDIERVQDLRLVIENMLRAGELRELGGLGVYRGWIHVDIRPRPADGHIARWAGKGIGAEETA